MTGLSALRSLTPRGRGLVAVGLVAGALGVLVGQRDLIRVGALLLALPCLALVVLARGRVRLSCTRELSRSTVSEGGDVEVRLRLSNVSRLTTGLLLLSDRVPRVLGDSPRFLLAPVPPGSSSEVRYGVRGGVRGRYELGPLSVRLTDPFGLCELVRVFPGALPLVVTPAVETLPPVRLGGDRAAAGEGGSRSVATSGDEDFSTREWRQGDDLRKVHWRSTARTGELMVRQEEQLSRARAVVVLDVRSRSHVGSGPASSLETAVRAAASIGVHLLRAGSGLRLLPVGGAVASVSDTRTGRSASRSTSTRGAGRRPGRGSAGGPAVPLPVDLDGDGAVELLLEQLAVLPPGQDAAPLGAALDPLTTGPPRETLVVAVLGRLDVPDADALARLRTGGRTCVAVVVAPPASAGEASGGEPVDLLRAAGWHVVVQRAAGTLAAGWAQLGAGAAPAPGGGTAPGPGAARVARAGAGAGAAGRGASAPVPAQPGPTLHPPTGLHPPTEPERTSR